MTSVSRVPSSSPVGWVLPPPHASRARRGSVESARRNIDDPPGYTEPDGPMYPRRATDATGVRADPGGRSQVGSPGIDVPSTHHAGDPPEILPGVDSCQTCPSEQLHDPGRLAVADLDQHPTPGPV